jgi:hypothetical protein
MANSPQSETPNSQELQNAEAILRKLADKLPTQYHASPLTKIGETAQPKPLNQPSSPSPSPAQAAAPQPPPPAESPKTEPTGNDAVSRCRHAHDEALKDATKRGVQKWNIDGIARRAYVDAMPPLHGAENIRDFIACVAYAMLINLIPASEGSKYLYAAQTAYQAHRPSQQNRKSQ